MFLGSSFVLDYFLLVIFASCGLYQMAAAYNDLRGLLFCRSRRWAFLLGLALWAGAFTWFFLSEPRNQPDTGLGLTGNEQFGFFFAGSGTGLTATLLLSSLRNWSLGRGASSPAAGLDVLRESNYLRALYRTLRPWLRVLIENRSTRSKAGLPGVDGGQGKGAD